MSVRALPYSLSFCLTDIQCIAGDLCALNKCTPYFEAIEVRTNKEIEDLKRKAKFDEERY